MIERQYLDELLRADKILDNEVLKKKIPGQDESGYPLLRRVSKVPGFTFDGEMYAARQLAEAKAELRHSLFREAPEPAYSFLYTLAEKLQSREKQIETVLCYRHPATAQEARTYFFETVKQYQQLERSLKRLPESSPELREYYVEQGVQLSPNLDHEPLVALSSQIKNDPTLETATRSAVGERQQDYLHCRTTFAEANLRLVLHIAGKYAGQGVDYQDLIQEGNIGLLRAIDRFDYQQGRFSTFAVWWIRRNISNSLGTLRTIRIPGHKRDERRRMKKAELQLEQQLQRNVSVQELADLMEQPREKIEELQQQSRVCAYLDQAQGEEGDYTLYDRLEDKASISPFDVSRYAELREAVQQALQTLSLREADIIRYRSGINQEREYTLQEVGDKYSLTRERIRQLEDKAKRKLRKPLQPWNESSW